MVVKDTVEYGECRITEEDHFSGYWVISDQVAQDETYPHCYLLGGEERGAERTNMYTILWRLST